MRKNKNIAHTGISDRPWFVYSGYEIVAKRLNGTANGKEIEIKTIIQTREESTKYFLTDPGIYQDLLVDYLKIKNAKGVLEFVRKWGFLDESDFTFPEEFSDFKINGFPGMDYKNFSGKGCIVSEVIDSAAYLDWLIELSVAINKEELNKLNNFVSEVDWETSTYLRKLSEVSDEKSKEQMIKLDTYLVENGWEAAVAVRVRDKLNKVSHFETRECSGDYVLMPCDEGQFLLIFPAPFWKKLGNLKGIIAASLYLKRAVKALLRGIQPILDWNQTVDGDWNFEERMLVETPWQAICYAMLLNISGKDRLVLCPRCAIRFRPSHKGHHFCSPACSKAVSEKRIKENKGPKFTKYPKTRKGKQK